MTIKIREFTPNDKNELGKLIIYLQNFESDLEPNFLNRGEVIIEKYASALTRNISEKSGKIYISSEDDQVTGFIAGYLENTPGEVELINQEYFYISDLAVYPQFQGKGIGKTLLAEMEKYAKKLGVEQIQINVLSRNVNTKRIYEKAGYRDYESILVKEL